MDSVSERDIEAYLVGRSIVATDPKAGYLILDNGMVLELAGNEGCGGCANGHYALAFLANAPINGIMSTEIVEDDDEYGDAGNVRLFVLAQDDRIEVAIFEGHDNGYYGTGFHVTVVHPGA